MILCYNGLELPRHGIRGSEHHDTDTDGDVDGNDTTFHFVYDDSWRIVASYVNDDAAADAKELFIYHCAGDGGYGSSSYIDAVILRDADRPLSANWYVASDGDLENRRYYCQNWRADVSVVLGDDGRISERVMYSAYGVPFGIPAGDLVTSATIAEPADGTVDGADQSVLLGQWGAGWDTADLDNDGDVDGFDLAILNGNWGKPLGWSAVSLDHNRIGYAGYVFDEALAGTKWHVRYRVLESVLGRWISRDLIEFGDNLFEYVDSNVLPHLDATGLFADSEPLLGDGGYYLPPLVQSPLPVAADCSNPFGPSVPIEMILDCHLKRALPDAVPFAEPIDPSVPTSSPIDPARPPGGQESLGPAMYCQTVTFAVKRFPPDWSSCFSNCMAKFHADKVALVLLGGLGLDYLFSPIAKGEHELRMAHKKTKEMNRIRKWGLHRILSRHHPLTRPFREIARRGIKGIGKAGGGIAGRFIWPVGGGYVVGVGASCAAICANDPWAF